MKMMSRKPCRGKEVPSVYFWKIPEALPSAGHGWLFWRLWRPLFVWVSGSSQPLCWRWHKQVHTQSCSQRVLIRVPWRQVTLPLCPHTHSALWPSALMSPPGWHPLPSVLEPKATLHAPSPACCTHSGRRPWSRAPLWVQGGGATRGGRERGHRPSQGSSLEPQARILHPDLQSPTPAPALAKAPAGPQSDLSRTDRGVLCLPSLAPSLTFPVLISLHAF